MGLGADPAQGRYQGGDHYLAPHPHRGPQDMEENPDGVDVPIGFDHGLNLVVGLVGVGTVAAMSIDRAVYQQALRSDGEAIAAAGRRDLNAAVPSCPGWTVHKLLAHVGRVYRSVGRHVAERAVEMIPADEIPRPPEGDAIVEWFEEGHRFVQDALDGADPGEAVWSWAGQNTMAFYFRRMAHETAVHRWDAEAAFGEPSPIGSDLGADGVSEMFEVVLPFSVANWDMNPARRQLASAPHRR